MTRPLTLFSALIVTAVSASWAQAEPVALIEDINVQREDFQVMDFLDLGTKIELKTDETMVLGYLDSCIQETIRGGTITVGEARSVIVGGQVKRKLLTCEGNTKTSVTRSKKGDAGAVVFRNKTIAKMPKAEHDVYGLSPLIYLTVKANEVYLTRIDGKGKSYKIAVKNSIADLAQNGIKLRRNVSYRLKAGKRTTTFKVSAKARRKVAVLSRLLRF